MHGDKCTPEGKFKMITKHPHKEWSKFIWINYPMMIPGGKLMKRQFKDPRIYEVDHD